MIKERIESFFNILVLTIPLLHSLDFKAFGKANIV